MTPRWRPLTLLDHLRAAGVVSADANTNVHCGCGRITTADMLADVRGLPPASRACLRHTDPVACDACRSRLVREGHITAPDLAHHLGAPADVVARLRSRFPQDS